MIVHQSMRHPVWAICIDKLDGYESVGLIGVHLEGHGDRVCVETDNPKDAGHVFALIQESQTEELAARREARLAAKRRHYQTL